MRALTRPIRRLLRSWEPPGRRRRPSRSADRARGRCPRRPRSGLDRGRHRRVRSAPRLSPDRARAGRARPPRARLAGGRRDLRAAGVALVVPLVSQGELIGTLNLGPRLSEQDYSTDDRRLLTTLAAQAAPAIRVAQLVREQAHEAAERERLEQEMRVATLIQQQFLPRELPEPAASGRSPPTTARPARSAATSTTSSRCPAGGSASPSATSPTRACRRRWSWPGPIRSCAPRRAAAIRPARSSPARTRCSCPEMPARMFVTCLFAILDPATGRIVLANAGHNLPYVRTDDGVIELRATGMPLGLMPDITYEETEGVIAPGSNVLLYSDGLVEAHDPDQEMYGFPRLREAMAVDDAGSELLDRLLDTLHAVHRPRLGAGGRHHARHPAPSVRRGRGRRRGERARPCTTALLDPGRGRQRAPGDGPGRGRRRRPGHCRRRGSSGSRRPSARRR